MYADQIADSFVQKTKRPHQPEFRIKKEKRGWRVYDGDTAIAFFYPTFLDIWSFSPFEAPILYNEQEPGTVADIHTVHNTLLNFALHGWPKHWANDGRDPYEGILKWRWVKKAGTELEAEVTGSFAEGERGRWVVRVWYDPSWGRYRYEVEVEAWKRDPRGFEPLNMMLAGALCCCDEDRRWTHTIWENGQHQLRRLVHSNVLLIAQSYGTTRNIPDHGAWVAYAAHPLFNPTVLIRDNNVPLMLATCNQLFDEHIIWHNAGMDNLQEDGLYHFRMVCEFVNLGGPLARRLLEQAQDPVHPKRCRQEHISLPFRMGVTNSFEKQADTWAPEDCPLFVIPAEQEGPVAWADDAAHSGERSIRLTGRTSEDEATLYPIGAVCNVQPHHRHRLSGWIKTKQVGRFARLELASYESRYDNTIDLAASPNVTGTKDWTRVEVILNSGDEAYLMPYLRLYGPGVAWFDDLTLEEV